MTQRSLHWDGASVGDADLLTVNAGDGIGYRLANEDYESPLVDRMFRMLWNGDEDRGVLKNWGGELAVTGVATPVSVATGGAVVYGMPYENATVPVSVAVASPTTDTRQDLIVLRRNWAAQTVRITKIDGVEGGGVPAMTQSPAPSGTGIYDIPLASLSITTGGVITVTDLREYCLYGSGIVDGAIDTAQIANDAVDFIDRETREHILFFGGGDLQPALINGAFYPIDSMVITGTAGWDGAANEEGWQLTGSRYEGVYCAFQVPPPDYRPIVEQSPSGLTPGLETYLWWVSNVGLASTFTLYSAYQIYHDTELATTGTDNTTINETLIANAVQRTQLDTIPNYKIGGQPGYTEYNKLIYYVMWNNVAGAEDINILGIEFRYTGYG